MLNSVLNCILPVFPFRLISLRFSSSIQGHWLIITAVFLRVLIASQCREAHLSTYASRLTRCDCLAARNLDHFITLLRLDLSRFHSWVAMFCMNSSPESVGGTLIAASSIRSRASLLHFLSLHSCIQIS